MLIIDKLLLWHKAESGKNQEQKAEKGITIWLGSIRKSKSILHITAPTIVTLISIAIISGLPILFCSTKNDGGQILAMAIPTSISIVIFSLVYLLKTRSDNQLIARNLLN